MRRTAAIASSLIGIGMAPASAAAHHPDHAPANRAGGIGVEVRDEQVLKTLGKDVKEENGVYRVDVPGSDKDVLTHGADTPQAVAALGGTGFSTNSPKRPPVCATDRFQHFLYARAPGAPDRLSEYRSYLNGVIGRMNAVLNRESLASGGGTADYKVLCDSSGQPRIDRLVSGADFSTIVGAAKLGGYMDPRADYTIFFDTGDQSRCGVGSFYPDETAGMTNRNATVTGYGVAYRRCWGTSAPMHENAHNQGAVQRGAPHTTGTGDHCWQETDILCYAPDGGSLHQWTVTSCGDYDHFDCSHDDYFDTATESGEYLASHWNMGSSANPFIAKGHTRPVSYGTSRLWRGLTLNPDVSAAPGRFHSYRMVIPKGARNLKIRMYRRSCQPSCQFKLDLYLRRGSKPTAGSYTCRRRGDTAGKVCTIRRPKSGVWYAGVRTRSGPAGAPYKISSTWRR